jgi:membrane protease YdiL (CAAX protease family)
VVAEPRSPITAVTRVLAFFGVLLLILIVHATTAEPMREKGLTPQAARSHLHSMVGFEIFDAIVVGIAVWAIGHPPEWRRLSDAPAGWLWAAAVAGLGLVLAVNLAYHTALRGYIGLAPSGDPILAVTGVTPLVLFAYCLEPAVIEELFFRYLALDTLRGVMNVHAAVAVSSVMFGLAHIGVPLSIPMLALVGMALGYARVASGRLALPMLLHFLHNFVIVLMRG